MLSYTGRCHLFQSLLNAAEKLHGYDMGMTWMLDSDPMLHDVTVHDVT